MSWDGESLLGLSRRFMESRVFLTGAELGLYGLLAHEALTADELAARTGSVVRPLTITLDALAAMGILAKAEGRYQVPEELREVLDPASETSILPMVLHAAGLWQRWSALTGLSTGELPATPQPSGPPDPAGMRAFIGAMHVVGGRLAPGVMTAIEPGSAQRLLDVGGASGTYTIAFLQACPTARATLFDRPPVIEMARERLAPLGLLDRVDLVPGDFYHDPLPGGHDLCLLSAIIHQNSPEQNVELYRQCFAALAPGRRIVVRDHVLSEDRTQPPAGAMFAVNMLVATPAGNSYTFAEIRATLETAGFERVTLRQPDGRMDGLVDAWKP